MKKYNRIYAVLIAVMLAAGLGAGCAKEEQNVKAEKEKVTLWYYWGQRYNKKELANLVDGFNRSQDKIEVKTEYVPDEDFKKRLALSMADDTMPELALVDSSDFQYFNDMEPFVDLTDEIEGIEQYLPEVKAACSVDGRMLGLPYGMNCSVLYYNKTIFEKHHIQVPISWAEFSVEWPYISIVITDAMEEEIIGEKAETEILRDAANRIEEIRRGDL